MDSDPQEREVTLILSLLVSVGSCSSQLQEKRKKALCHEF